MFLWNVLYLKLSENNGFISLCCKLYCQFSSVTQSCPTLCEPMNCSTPGLPVQLIYFTDSSVYLGEGNGTPLQYCCPENPMDGGAW